jgi:hypothetical protein
MAALRARALSPVWRALSAVSLVFLAWCLWQVIATATYVATLYGSLGRGIAVALGLAVAAVALFTLPVACWGLAYTGRRSATAPPCCTLPATTGLRRAAITVRTPASGSIVCSVITSPPMQTRLASRERLETIRPVRCKSPSCLEYRAGGGFEPTVRTPLGI